MAEGLQRPEGVNILKGQVRVEGVERGHVAAENIGEQRRMLRMKFYITGEVDDGWGLRCVMYVFYTNKYLRIDYVIM